MSEVDVIRSLRDWHKPSTMPNRDEPKDEDPAPLKWVEWAKKDGIMQYVEVEQNPAPFTEQSQGPAEFKKSMAQLTASADPKPLPKRAFIMRNPMQDTDYRLYETLEKHTFVGPLFSAFVRYIVARGFKPELVLRDPDEGDSEANHALIKANHHVTKCMLAIDRHAFQRIPGELDTPAISKWTALISSCLMMNRGALLFSWGLGSTKPPEFFKWDPEKGEPGGRTWEGVPSGLVFAHARDLGEISVNPANMNMRAVKWRHSIEEVPVDRMIYLWNQPSGGRTYQSWGYGGSMFSPLAPAAKLIRMLLTEDFPAMSKATWARLYLVAVKPFGATRDDRVHEAEEISSLLKPGYPGIIMKDPSDIEVHDLDFNPPIDQFLELMKSMIMLCVSIMGLPQVGFYDESAANLATMRGKIELTKRTTIEPMREWIGESIADQWYRPFFEEMFADQKVKPPEAKPDAESKDPAKPAEKKEPDERVGKPITEVFDIKIKWSDINVIEFYEVVQSALEIDGRGQLKNEAFGELLGRENYPEMLEKDAEITPGGLAASKGIANDDDSGNSENKKGTPGKGGRSTGAQRRKDKQRKEREK